MSNILITGGAGFLGSHLVERLLECGDRVTVVDDMSMGKRENLPEHKNLRIVEAAVEDMVSRYLGKFGDTDTVYHLAALTRPRESFVQMNTYNGVNVGGVLTVLNDARNFGVKNFVFVSSASAYGYQDIFPFKEDAQLNPASPYATTKQIGEDYCKLFTKISDMRINWIRPFNVYGERQDPHSPYGAAVPKFIDALRTGKRPFITGDGSQYRDFIYVEDVVDLMIAIANSKCNGEAFNGGSGQCITIKELYETICKIMGKDVRPDYVEPVSDPNTLADISKAKRLLGWEPKYSLGKGLTRTIERTT